MRELLMREPLGFVSEQVRRTEGVRTVRSQGADVADVSRIRQAFATPRAGRTGGRMQELF